MKRVSIPCEPELLAGAYDAVLIRAIARKREERKKQAAQVADKLLGIVRCRDCGEGMPRQDIDGWKSGDSWVCDGCLPF